MNRENELHLSFQHILNTAKSLDEAKSFYKIIAKIYPIENKVIVEEAKVGA